MQNGAEKKQGIKKRIIRAYNKEGVDFNNLYWFILCYNGVRIHKLIHLLEKDFEESEVWHPVYTILKYNHKKLEYETRYIPFYPNYLFLKTNLSYIFSERLQTTTGRVRFLESGGNYYHLNDEEIEIIKTLEKEYELEKRFEDDLGYKVGDIVKILNGPFHNCSGEITFLNKSKKKASLRILMFGRDIMIEVDIKDIKII